MIDVVLEQGAVLPTASPGDGWWDLAACREIIIPSNGVQRVPTGIRMDLPSKAKIEGRSGLASRSRFPIGGCIDRGYRGVWDVVLVNLSGSAWHIRTGDRIAQFDFESTEYNPDNWYELPWNWTSGEAGTGDPISPFQIVESLTETERGEKGFGSSGD